MHESATVNPRRNSIFFISLASFSPLGDFTFGVGFSLDFIVFSATASEGFYLLRLVSNMVRGGEHRENTKKARLRGEPNI